jgi:hypothetical protein
MFVTPGDRAGRRRVRPGTSLRQLGNSSGGGLDLTTTAVTPGSYTLSSITVGSDGRLTSASSGSSGNQAENSWTTPTVAALTFVNNTNYTTTDDTNGVFVQRTASLANSDSLCLAHKTIPAGTWDLIVRIIPYWADDVFAHGGVHLYESGTGKIMTFGNQGTSGGQRLNTLKFTNTTTFSASQKTVACTHRYLWYKVHYDTTNITWYMGMDGYSWVQWDAVSKTSFFTTAPTHGGFFIDGYGTNFGAAIKCLSFTMQ